jgi:signal transduction histidine kinase
VQFPGSNLDPIRWDSPTPKPHQQQQTKVQEFSHNLLGKDSRGRDDRRAQLHCEYRMHVYTEIQRQNEEQAKVQWVVGGLVLSASMAALFWVYYYLRRDRLREAAQFRTLQDKEQAERLLLENELHREELDKKLLAQRLDTAKIEQRAAEAETNAAELKSQLYASIGIMAGSYAHNIKNLLVRPNDLLARCLEADGLSMPQSDMLHEVQQTLGTVTERLQQILRTVRRDPNRSEVIAIDLNEVIGDTCRTWQEMARDKWKVIVTADIPAEPLVIRGDLSHLQQAIENLLFNARDSTFEMRNHLREKARTDPKLDAATRRQAVIDAAAWKGAVALKIRADGDDAILEVSDNGIGMTADVRLQCTQTHFTTKRDNALYEGYNAGMGLGLSFVAMVLEHHAARLEIESELFQGARFRLRFSRLANEK